MPPTGAFYCILSPKYAGGIYSECRAFAVVGDPLARRLIDSARKKNVVDLSVVLAEDLPLILARPGRGQPPPAAHEAKFRPQSQHAHAF